MQWQSASVQLTGTTLYLHAGSAPRVSPRARARFNRLTTLTQFNVSHVPGSLSGGSKVIRGIIARKEGEPGDIRARRLGL